MQFKLELCSSTSGLRKQTGRCNFHSVEIINLPLFIYFYKGKKAFFTPHLFLSKGLTGLVLVLPNVKGRREDPKPQECAGF